MTTTEIALREPNGQAIAMRSTQITDVQRLGGLLAASGYFSDARDMAQAAVKVMAGEELGIPPVAAMMGINIIKGKIALGGNLIASRIRAHGYDYRHKRFDSTGCVLEFLSKPDTAGKRSNLGESAFTEEDAKTAGVFTDMYRKYPRNMYFNRAISNGAKWYTPEVFAGAPVYVPEELGARIDENGDMVHEPTREEQTQAQRLVLDRKLEEIRKSEPAAASSGTGSHDSSEVSSEEQLSPMDQALLTFTCKANIAAAFTSLKSHFLLILDQSVWEQILAEHHVSEQPWKFDSIGNAKKCFTALWKSAERATQEIPLEEPAQ